MKDKLVIVYLAFLGPIMSVVFGSSADAGLFASLVGVAYYLDSRMEKKP